MRRREARGIEKHTVNFYVGQYQRLQGIYGSRIGAAKVIRDLVDAHIRMIQNKAEQRVNVNLIDDLEIQLPTDEVQP